MDASSIYSLLSTRRCWISHTCCFRRAAVPMPSRNTPTLLYITLWDDTAHRTINLSRRSLQHAQRIFTARVAEKRTFCCQAGARAGGESLRRPDRRAGDARQTTLPTPSFHFYRFAPLLFRFLFITFNLSTSIEQPGRTALQRPGVLDMPCADGVWSAIPPTTAASAAASASGARACGRRRRLAAAFAPIIRRACSYFSVS